MHVSMAGVSERVKITDFGVMRKHPLLQETARGFKESCVDRCHTAVLSGQVTFAVYPLDFYNEQSACTHEIAALVFWLPPHLILVVKASLQGLTHDQLPQTQQHRNAQDY